MSTDVERVVIGALLRAPVVIDEIDLVPEDFSIVSFRVAYKAISEMYSAGNLVDIITVSDYLLREHPGETWLSLLGGAAKDCPSPSMAKSYSEMVKAEAQVRRAKALSAELIDAIDVGGMDAVDECVKGLMELSRTKKNHSSGIGEVMNIAVEAIDRAVDTKGPVGVGTGIDELNKSLGGLHNSFLVIIGGRPAMGKTAMMLNLAHNSDVPVGIISAEQPKQQIGIRLIALNKLLDGSQLMNGWLPEAEYKKVTQATTNLNNHPGIWVNDKPNINIHELERQARKWKHEHDIGALFVDYVQIIKWPDRRADKRIQVGGVVEALKQLARELDIPVVGLSQVNRNCEDRVNKRPMLSDLKEAGEIEQAADDIILLYRDEVYFDDSPDKGVIEMIVGKNRHGPTGTIYGTWIARAMKVENLVRGYTRGR